MSRLRYLQVPVVLGLFAFLAYQLDPQDLADALSGADPAVVIAVVALNIPMCLLFGARMDLVLRRFGHHLAPDLVLASAVVGNVAGALTPASSGEILRAVALRSHSEVSLDDAVALIVFERGMSVYLLSLGTLAAFCTLALPLWGAVLGCVVCVGALVLPSLFAPVLNHLPNLTGDSLFARAIARLRPIAGQLYLLLRSPRLVIPWFATTALIFTVFAAQYWLLAVSVEDVVTPREVWIAVGASQLAAIISLIPFGLGASDASLAAILHRYGMTFAGGAAVAILGRATSTLPLIILAAVAWVYLSRKAPLQRTAPGDIGTAAD